MTWQVRGTTNEQRMREEQWDLQAAHAATAHTDAKAAALRAAERATGRVERESEVAVRDLRRGNPTTPVSHSALSFVSTPPLSRHRACTPLSFTGAFE
jgi:hypothetical protein